jgi:predicted TIM-barrel fold metal-dependent hydrolase
MIKAAALSICTISLFSLLFAERSSAVTQQFDKSQVLDMHCHVAGIGAGNSGAFLSEKMRNSWKYKIYLKAFGVNEKEILEHGDQLVVRRISERLSESEQVGGAILLALDGVIDENGQLDRQLTESYIPNDFLATEVAKYENLYFGASVNPHRHDALQRLEQAKTDGALLIKWLPAIQRIDPADKQLIPFYQKLVELDLPLLTHAGDEHAFTYADNRLGDPQKLQLPLKLGVKVIVAHAATSGKSAGEDNMQRLLPMFDQYPNLYTDISALTMINKLRFVPKLLKAGIDPQRMLYGTDFPLITTGLAAPIFSSLQLSAEKSIQLTRINNPWDQDIQLKLAHGFPRETFTSAAKLLLK